MDSKKKSGKKGKKVFFAVALVILVVVGFFGYRFWQGLNAAADVTSSQTALRTMTLGRTSIINSIAVSGTIYSNTSQNVYTTQNYPIKEIYVDVNDQVEAGDVLAVLDMTNLDYDIRQAEINLENNKLSLVESQNTLNANIQNAEVSLASSAINLQRQQDNYDRLKRELDNETSASLISAKNSVEAAEQSMKSSEKDISAKESDYENSLLLFEADIITKNELTASENAAQNAREAYETAVANYDKAVESLQRTKQSLRTDIDSVARDIESAKLSYQSAENSLEQARKRTETTSSSIEIQEITLQKLRDQRAESDIIAPISGTIIQANATIGSTAAGSSGGGASGNTLFLIEDMNDLYVSTSVKEFRIGEISIGQEAWVSTDATGGSMFGGVLDFIAPTATETSSATNVEFEIRIRLTETDPLLKIGMNAYASIVLDSKENVFVVGYDAVYSDRQGNSYIYALENDVITSIRVITGIENDTSIEISGEELRDGMIVYTSATAVQTEQFVGGGAGQFTGGGGTGQLPDGSGQFQRGEDGSGMGEAPQDGIIDYDGAGGRGRLPFDDEGGDRGQIPPDGEIRGSGRQFPRDGDTNTGGEQFPQDGGERPFPQDGAERQFPQDGGGRGQFQQGEGIGQLSQDDGDRGQFPQDGGERQFPQDGGGV